MIPMRALRHPDGSHEIICVLNDETLQKWVPNQPLAYEKSILWLHPIQDLDFVRVAYIRNANSRRGPLVARGVGLVAGYSKLTEDAPRDPRTQVFTRRLFYLTEEDLSLNLNQIPTGVFDPRTILPRRQGRAPRRADLNRGYPWWACTAPAASSS
ncbi:MAG: DUF6009 family protein [Pirellulaceae bacterium]